MFYLILSINFNDHIFLSSVPLEACSFFLLFFSVAQHCLSLLWTHSIYIITLSFKVRASANRKWSIYWEWTFSRIALRIAKLTSIFFTQIRTTCLTVCIHLIINQIRTVFTVGRSFMKVLSVKEKLKILVYIEKCLTVNTGVRMYWCTPAGRRSGVSGQLQRRAQEDSFPSIIININDILVSMLFACSSGMSQNVPVI